MKKTISEWQKEVYAVAKEKGWHDIGKDKSFAECVVLVHAELSEAIEEYRKPNLEKGFLYYSPKGKPEGISIELADVAIRVFDMCEQFDIDLEKAIEIKNEYNKTRSYRHGNKKI